MVEFGNKFIKLHVLNDFLYYLILRPSVSWCGKPTLPHDGKEMGRQLAPQGLGDMKAVCTSPGMGKPQAETEKWSLPNFLISNFKQGK